MQQYADLELVLHKDKEGIYSVQFRYIQPGNEAEIGLGQEKPVLVELNVADEAFDPQVLDAEAYGTALTSALFKNQDLKDAFKVARTNSQGMNLPLRIRLGITAGSPELHRLRWELLRDPHDNTLLSTDGRIYFSRFYSSQDWRRVLLKQKGNLRAVVAAAYSPDLKSYKGFAEINVAEEVERARQGMAKADIAVLSLPQEGRPASANEIIKALNDEGSDILYLVCHGVMANGHATLYLEGPDGKHEVVDGEEFAQRINGLEKTPRLALLVSCQSAGNGSGDVLSALGPRLVKAGIPAVIAMQTNLSVDTADKFLPAFFDELRKDGQIDRALNVARSMISKQNDFWAPVLFMRLKSGHLWYTPGFSTQSGGSDYETEIRYINRETCTPIIGPGLLEELLGPSSDIAFSWSQAFHYPMAPNDRDALPKVAQFLLTEKGAAVPFDMYEEEIQRTLRRNFKADLPPAMLAKKWVETDDLVNAIGTKRRASDQTDPYRILAEIPFTLYISANPDRQLEDALLEKGRKPEAIISPWKEELASRKTIFDREPDYVPSAERPLIFYLFGRWSDRETMVLTEDEYIRYLIGFTNNRAFVPEPVREALSNTLLLFLGFQTEEWSFRVIFHCILSLAGSKLLGKYAHIAAQIEPYDERTIEPQRARQYLEKYFIKGANVNIFWGQASDYLSGLIQKWNSDQAK